MNRYDAEDMESDSTGSIVLLVRLARVIYRRSTEDLLGIHLKQFAALAFLRDQEGTGRPTTQQGLLDALCLDANTCVLLLNDLEEAGFAERHRDPSDRRRHVVNLTKDGRRALENAERAQAGIEDDVLSALSAKERTTLRHLIEKALNEHGH